MRGLHRQGARGGEVEMGERGQSALPTGVKLGIDGGGVRADWLQMVQEGLKYDDDWMDKPVDQTDDGQIGAGVDTNKTARAESLSAEKLVTTLYASPDLESAQTVLQNMIDAGVDQFSIKEKTYQVANLLEQVDALRASLREGIKPANTKIASRPIRGAFESEIRRTTVEKNGNSLWIPASVIEAINKLGADSFGVYASDLKDPSRIRRDGHIVELLGQRFSESGSDIQISLLVEAVQDKIELNQRQYLIIKPTAKQPTPRLFVFTTSEWQQLMDLFPGT